MPVDFVMKFYLLTPQKMYNYEYYDERSNEIFYVLLCNQLLVYFYAYRGASVFILSAPAGILYCKISVLVFVLL